MELDSVASNDAMVKMPAETVIGEVVSLAGVCFHHFLEQDRHLDVLALKNLICASSLIPVEEQHLVLEQAVLDDRDVPLSLASPGAVVILSMVRRDGLCERWGLPVQSGASSSALAAESRSRVRVWDIQSGRLLEERPLPLSVGFGLACDIRLPTVRGDVGAAEGALPPRCRSWTSRMALLVASTLTLGPSARCC